MESYGIFSINLWRTSDRTIRRLFRGQGEADGIAWSDDGKHLAYSDPSADSSLWELELAHPDHPEKLPVGSGVSQVVANALGKKLAYMKIWQNVNIWRLDLGSGEPRAHKLVTPTREQNNPSISPDGSKIAFESDRSGSREVWICDRDGSNAIQVTSFGVSNTGTPSWSPDGKRLVLDSRAGGEANVYTVEIGGVPHKLETGTHDNSVPSWSHDGQWIYFVGRSASGSLTAMKVSPDGGRAVQITPNKALLSNGGLPLKESPDGLYIYFNQLIDGKYWLWRVRTDGSDEQPVAGMPDVSSADAWCPVRSGIYYIANSGNKTEIQYFDLTTSQAQRVYVLEKPPRPWIGGLAVSGDGTQLLFSQIDEKFSELMLIENWR